MKRVRVILWGLGAMGSGIAKALLQRSKVEIVGALEVNESLVGKTLSSVIGEGDCHVVITNDPSAVLKPGVADIALIATSSFTQVVVPQIEQAVRAGMNVITIAEEMAYPMAHNQELACSLDALAKEQGVTILGTGINPGFVLDTLIIMLTGVSLDVQAIHAKRVNDLSPFGPMVMRTQGVGTTPEQFEAGIKDGTIVGHVGFPQSMAMIADALGWRLDEIVEKKEPIISTVYRKTPYVEIEPGMVAGCRHIAYGKRNGEVILTMEHPQQVRPDLAGVETGDYIQITGTPDINLHIKPEIPGGIGTIAMAVNMIPHVLEAAPGLKTMRDLRLPVAMLPEVMRLC
ncbi:MAG: NADP-binding protein [Firmicutes bacterium]|nr:NADP-binding protein [Bacillota bacterium]